MKKGTKATIASVFAAGALLAACEVEDGHMDDPVDNGVLDDDMDDTTDDDM